MILNNLYSNYFGKAKEKRVKTHKVKKSKLKFTA